MTSVNDYTTLSILKTLVLQVNFLVWEVYLNKAMFKKKKKTKTMTEDKAQCQRTCLPEECAANMSE